MLVSYKRLLDFLLSNYLNACYSVLQNANANVPNTNEAGSANTPTNINVTKISLSPVIKYEVANKSPTYRQCIHYNGVKLMFMMPEFEVGQVSLRKPDSDVSVLVPVGEWMRRQFNLVEKFVQQNVILPLETIQQTTPIFYKPLWQDL